MYNILVTGGAGFIGSNLCERLLELGHSVRCLDNFSTGKFENIEALLRNYKGRFTLQVGDIRDAQECHKAAEGMDYVFHEAALGSVPRSIFDPQTTNEVNVSGFLNMLVASHGAGVKRFMYAASSSTYGDSQELPKVEEVIGRPLSPYAVTKYVNELYADVFSRVYGLECIGFRYFNVFGRKQSPDGAYAAVIPKFVQQLIHHQPLRINGDGTYSRDFTYIDNVIQINLLGMETQSPEAVNTVYNTAYGESTTLNQLVDYLKHYLGEYDPGVADVKVIHASVRQGDIPHSLASIDKARRLLGYDPHYSIQDGLKEAVEWYWNNLK